MIEAFTLLKKDHATVKDILSEILATTSRATQKRVTLMAKLKEELQLHEKIEEKLLYPVIKAKPDMKDMTLEAYEEHYLVDDLLVKIENTDVTDESWKAKVTVLQECLQHHINEEEKEIFPKAKIELNDAELAKMAEGIKAMKQAAQKS